MENPDLLTVHFMVGEEITKFFPKRSIVAIGFSEFDEYGNPQLPAGVIYDENENDKRGESAFIRVANVILSTKRGCAPKSETPALTLEVKNSNGDVFGLISILVDAEHFGEAETGVAECEIREHILAYLKTEEIVIGKAYGNLYY